MRKDRLEPSEIDVSEISNLLRRKKSLEAKIERLKGRFEEARRSLKALECECVELGFSGSGDLDKAIKTLDARIKSTHTILEEKMVGLEQKLKTYEV